MTKTRQLTPAEVARDPARILRAFRQGTRDALRRHELDGDPIAVWRDGEVVWIEAQDIQIPDEPADFDAGGESP